MVEYKPPYKVDEALIKGKIRIFLAGSIDNGKATDWQSELVSFLSEYDTVLFNPRREVLEVDFTQGTKDSTFVEQVQWEIAHILAAELVVFFIQSGSLSPITLYELGLISILVKDKKKKAIVCCEKGFWREGNVDVVCAVFDIESTKTMDELKIALVREVVGFSSIPEQIWEN